MKLSETTLGTYVQNAILVMYKNLLIHHLALGGPVQTADALTRLAAKAIGLGASGMEMLWRPVQNLTAKEEAKALRAAGATRSGFCIFNPGGDFGDPLSTNPDSQHIALRLVTEGMQHVVELRDQGIDVPVINGPWFFVLGSKPAQYDASSRKRAVEFLKRVAEFAETFKVRMAAESLQNAEDPLFRIVSRLLPIIEEVNSPWLGYNLDTFHEAKNGGYVPHSIRQLGERLFHFHANGIGQNVELEGRIPCGCQKYTLIEKGDQPASGPHSDVINWDECASALGAPREDRFVVLEPFCLEAVTAIEALRPGVVPVTNLEQIALSITNLANKGILLTN